MECSGSKKHINDMYEDNEVQLESWYYEYKTSILV